jgi:pimeloyl-ACP methyl ester carboxylesterase
MWRIHGIVVAVVTVLASLAPCSAANTAERTSGLVREEFMIDAADPGIKLYVVNKHLTNLQQLSSVKTLLFVHGATQPAEATFDLPFEGMSWMDYIARHGWDVYLVDVRGYGRSTRPAEMDQPAESNPPIVRTDVAIRDVGSAIDFILQRRGTTKINLMGWSWGTVIMAAYTAEHADKVARLVLYGPQWLESSPATSSPPLGAYITATMALAKERMQTGAPDDRKRDPMPAGSFEAWSTAALATDPVGSRQNPPVLRSPAGVFQDRQEFWRQGKPYYDPRRVTAPTLIVVGEWDRATPIEGAQELFRQLPSGPDKRLVEIGEGTHLLMLEKNRVQLFEEVQHFLDKGGRPY